jgi:hypothetical protein
MEEEKLHHLFFKNEASVNGEGETTPGSAYHF